MAKISVNILHHSLWDHKRFVDKTHTWQRNLYGQAKEQEISFRKHLRILGISSDKEMQKLLKILMRNHRPTSCLRMAGLLTWVVEICLIQRLKIDSATALTKGTGRYLGFVLLGFFLTKEMYFQRKFSLLTNEHFATEYT